MVEYESFILKSMENKLFNLEFSTFFLSVNSEKYLVIVNNAAVQTNSG